MHVKFLQQDNTISQHEQSLKKLFDFHNLDYSLIYVHVLFLQLF